MSKIEYGVPQGAVLIPTLFIKVFFINYAPVKNDKDETTLLFAGDIAYLLGYEAEKQSKCAAHKTSTKFDPARRIQTKLYRLNLLKSLSFDRSFRLLDRHR